MAKFLYDDLGRELRSHGNTLFPIAIYESNLNQEEVPVHWHDEFEAGFVTDGEILLTVGAETYTVSEGCGYLINSGILHSFLPIPGRESRQRSVVFAPSVVGGRADSIFWQKYCEPLLSHKEVSIMLLDDQSAWQSDAINTIRRTWNLCRGAHEEYELDVRHLLSHFLYLIHDHLKIRSDTTPQKLQRDSERLKIMLHHIHMNYAENLTIADVAASAMISHSECLRCFHDTIGTTPLRYLRDFRIRQAAESLLHTQNPIADIAASTGFSDVSYFTKVFREAKGCTPGEFRRRQ